MDLTGTVDAPDVSHDHITAAGETYDAARTTLRERVLEGHRLIVIRRS
ncbi:hypothetical protein [Pseudarthrobacter sp. MEB009]|nr:hypothetical protein [Pseudarthrobacter sp. MEB009]